MSSLLPPFVCALQASLSALIVIAVGVLACEFKLLDGASGKTISSLCVHMFLPALLVTQVGRQLNAETAGRYVPILVWSLFYNMTSITVGLFCWKFLNLPHWVTPAIAFNSSTSLPLLLIQSLNATGALSRLIMPNDTAAEALERAQSYFLICGTVGTCLTFAVGPRLIDVEPEMQDQLECERSRSRDRFDKHVVQHHETTAALMRRADTDTDSERTQVGADERTALLPTPANISAWHDRTSVSQAISDRRQTLIAAQKHTLSFLRDFVNAPLIGAVIGTIIGMVPRLQQAFFADNVAGGYLNAWVTASLSSIGQTFVPLQIMVVGVTLSIALKKMRNGEESGSVPWSATAVILGIRLIVWPFLSIAIVWLLIKRTNLLCDDPILWFAMMLMPSGPSAMKLLAMADVSGADQNEKMSIAKLLTISYALSPILAFSVVGALKVTVAAIDT